jgi:O-antigen/teichoic acid export membrane protein
VLGLGSNSSSALDQVRARLSGVAPVGAGLILLGISAYAFLALAGHALAPREYTAVASLYLLIAVVGPGVFAAVEQETSREISSRLATDRPALPVVRSAAVISAVLAAAVITLLLALSPLLVHRVFGGAWSLLVAAFVAVVGAASVHVVRGLFSGRRQYGWYGTSLAAEGLVRLVGSVMLVWVGIAGTGSDTAAFGFAFALGTLLAVAATVAGMRPGTLEPPLGPPPGPPVSLRKMTRGIGFLAGASALTLLLANIAPVVLTSWLTDDPSTAASFVSLFVLARIPLFLFSPVQAFLLPSLTAAVERGQAAWVRRQIRTMVVVAGALGVFGVAGAAVAGPWAARVFFNAPLELPGLVAALLAVSTVVMMVAQILQSALVALGKHRTAMSAWIAGTAVFGALLFVPTAPLVAVVAAQIAGPAVVVAIMARSIRASLAGSWTDA